MGAFDFNFKRSEPAAPPTARAPAPTRFTVLFAAAFFLCALAGAAAGPGVLLSGCREGPDRLVLGLVATSPGGAQNGGLPKGEADALAATASTALGIKIELFAFPTPSELIKALGSGQADIAVLGPYAYVAAHDDTGAQLLLKAVKDGQDSTRSDIVVAASSAVGDLAALKALKQKTFGFADPASPESYLFPAAYLIENGVVSKAELLEGGARFLGTDLACLQALLEGRVAAVGCAENALEAAEVRTPDLASRVRVIARTPPVPGLTVAVRAGLDARLADRVKQALLSVVNREEGRRAWKALTGTDGLVEAQEAEYDVIRGMVQTLGLDIEVLAAR